MSADRFELTAIGDPLVAASVLEELGFAVERLLWSPDPEVEPNELPPARDPMVQVGPSAARRAREA